MAVFTDQLNRGVNIRSVPKRIVSVVPSQTELLFYLGLNKEIIGITKFCIHPADKFKSTTKVGGTKQLNIEQIKALKPDLIIANKEENEQSQIEELMTICPVWISDISNLVDALDMIVKIGELVNRSTPAQTLANEIKQQFSKLTSNAANLKVAYLIWRKPYIIAGKGTFIDDMLSRCGFNNAFESNRYPEVTDEMLIEADPEIVLLSSEPYPFAQKHMAEFKLLLPNARVILVNGELFSWYGSRLLRSPAYFKQLIAAVTAME